MNAAISDKIKIPGFRRGFCSPQGVNSNQIFEDITQIVIYE